MQMPPTSSPCSPSAQLLAHAAVVEEEWLMVGISGPKQSKEISRRHLL